MTDRDSAAALPEDRSVLVVGLRGRVIGLDRMTGVVRWESAKEADGEVFLALGYGVVIAATSFNKVLVCLDYLTGERRWQVETTGRGRATILLEPDQIVCVRSGYLDCFLPDGRRLWSQPLQGRGEGRAALGYPGNVAQADEVGTS